ncbi:MAG: M3 family oligoendopeptidase [Anaerolineae bacterium]|nr:M3 family oligoendopeptidase [Anaerolineae bacterium]
MQETGTKLPKWDVTNVYPGLDTPEFEAGYQSLVKGIGKLEALFEEHAIQRPGNPPEINKDTVQIFEAALEQINVVTTQVHTLRTYIFTFIATDSRNTLAQAKFSAFQNQEVRIAKLFTRFVAWVGSLNLESLLEKSNAARKHAYTLHNAHIQAKHQMSPAEEILAQELNVTGGKAWAKFYNNYASQITNQIQIQGEMKTLPMTAIRNLAFSPDREIRRQAYEAELAAWEESAMPIAAALNSLKGQMLTLSHKRGWDSALDVALFDNHIDRETLEVMMQTAKKSFPHFRRYLKAKARALGVPTLAWYDIFAPVGESRAWTFEEAKSFIITQFGGYSEKLAGLAKRAFDENWIDAEPRDGKRGGAFCAWLQGEESRILSNFQPAYSGMGTLAHELGHAYHNMTRAERTYLQRETPMTLAETASNFCEIIVRDAALEQAELSEQMAILEASLQDACQVIVDITSRFIFESEVFEKRQARELSVEELNTIMLDAQRATYGDGLDETLLHPYMWAVKPHYYSATFYNFPYMFGLLFGLGLYACYQENPESFIEQYDDLLSATGMDNAADLAARFGIDIHTADFWQGSLDLLIENIDRFEKLVEEYTV